MTRVKEGGPVCGYLRLTSVVWTEESAAAVVNFVGGWAVDNGFDGVYLDSRLAVDKCTSIYKA